MLDKPMLFPSKSLFYDMVVLTVRQLHVKNLITVFISIKIKQFLSLICLFTFCVNNFLAFKVNHDNLTVCRRKFIYVCYKLINISPSDFIQNRITKEFLKDVDN